MIVETWELLVIVAITVAALWVAFSGRDSVPDEPPTLNTRGADPDDPMAGTH